MAGYGPETRCQRIGGFALSDVQTGGSMVVLAQRSDRAHIAFGPGCRDFLKTLTCQQELLSA